MSKGSGTTRTSSSSNAKGLSSRNGGGRVSLNDIINFKVKGMSEDDMADAFDAATNIREAIYRVDLAESQLNDPDYDGNYYNRSILNEDLRDAKQMRYDNEDKLKAILKKYNLKLGL